MIHMSIALLLLIATYGSGHAEGTLPPVFHGTWCEVKASTGSGAITLYERVPRRRSCDSESVITIRTNEYLVAEARCRVLAAAALVPNSAYRVRADCDNPEASGSAIFAITGGYLLMLAFDDDTN
jgi:hypothetical protein